jgi:hypothetical protein
MGYESELEMDVRLLWLHAFVLWLEHEPVLDKESEEQIRAASSGCRSEPRDGPRLPFGTLEIVALDEKRRSAWKAALRNGAACGR